MGLFDFLKPKWKSKNAEVRLAAIQTMGPKELGTLKTLAAADEDLRVRLAAVGRIGDPGALEQLAGEALGPEVLRLVRAKLDRLLCEAALGGSEPAGIESALGRVEDLALVELLAAQAPTPALRVKAVERIGDQEALCRIVETNCGREPARVALAKIDDERLLARIAQRGASKVTRRLAEEKLGAVASARTRKSEREEKDRELEARRDMAPRLREEAIALVEVPESAAREAEAEALAAAEALEQERRRQAELKAESERVEALAREQERERARQALADEARTKREALERRAELCAEFEGLVDVGDRVAAGRRVKELRKLWKELPSSQEKEVRALEERFRAAGDRFSARQAAFLEEQEWLRWNNKTLKEELCTAVEALDAEDDLGTVADKVKEAQRRWKEIGPAPKAEAEGLWQRFKSACDRDFERCKPYFEEVERQRAQGVERREELCRQAEVHVESTEWKTSAESLKRLQAEWKEADPIPRKLEEELYARFRQTCNRFFARRQAHFSELDEGRRGNQVEKERLCERAEALATVPNRKHSREFRELQADWKRLGPAPRDVEQALWERFRGACDRFFAWLDTGRQENLRRKEALCEEVEALVAGAADAADPREIAARIAELQKRWMEIGPAPKDDNDAIWERFHKPCNEFFEGLRQQSAKETEPGTVGPG